MKQVARSIHPFWKERKRKTAIISLNHVRLFWLTWEDPAMTMVTQTTVTRTTTITCVHTEITKCNISQQISVYEQ